ncbi:MAG: EpsG family protein [Flavobacterium sp.]
MRSPAIHNGYSASAKINEDVKKKFHLIMFLIWPVMGFAVACRDFSSRFNRQIILAFYTLYGFTFFINPTMDGQRYANHLRRLYDIPSENVSAIFGGLFSEQGELDLLQPVLTLLVSRFTSYHGILFAAFALVFGTIQLKSIYMLYTDTKEQLNKNVLILLCFLPLLLPVFSINGFRMWTAAWIFFYGAYNLTYRKKKLYILVCFASIFAHFSFFTLNIVLLCYLLGGNRRLIYTVLALISFTLSELPLASIQGYVENFGSGITRKFTSYTHERYMEESFAMREQAAWFIRWSGPLLKYFLTAGIALMYIRLKNVKISKEFNSLWCLTLLILTYANLVSTVPSGGRFLTIYYLFAVGLLIIFYAKYYNTRHFDKVILIGIFPMLLYSVVGIRVGLNTVNLTLFMPTPLMALFTDNGIPIF